MAQKLKYFYKTQDGRGWIADYVPRKDKGLIPITEEEWNAHIAELNQKREPTPEQVAKREKEKQIQTLKAQLRDTDYVVIKIAETTDEDEKAALRAEYASVLEQRKQARIEINRLEGELN